MKKKFKNSETLSFLLKIYFQKITIGYTPERGKLNSIYKRETQEEIIRNIETSNFWYNRSYFYYKQIKES